MGPGDMVAGPKSDSWKYENLTPYADRQQADRQKDMHNDHTPSGPYGPRGKSQKQFIS